MKIMAFIGVMWTAAGLIGAFVPDAAFHVYFGTEDGAAAWHKKHSEKGAPK